MFLVSDLDNLLWTHINNNLIDNKIVSKMIQGVPWIASQSALDTP